MKQVIFGYNAVAEALRSGHPLNRIYFSLSSRRPYIQELKALAQENNVRYDFVELAKLNVLANTGEHQDVVAITSPVEYVDLDDFLEANANVNPQLLVVLDQVQNSGNVGLIIRTAVAAGATGVILSVRGGSLINDQVFRASAGAIFHIPIIKSMSLQRDLQKLKDQDFWVYGLDAGGSSDVFNEKWAKRTAVVIGNEHAGPRDVTRKLFDLTVRIPMAKDFDSLNAAIAAGIVLFQISNYASKAGWR
ncbi:MAG: 23S rRNA (guanosine(2251)-2'-O)-methyltransferase RlmB [Anaerolineae bacterium]|nr:23S rRNA (guanosine(2251)-2'-O)-methyltransferase RlmB [Anaerolineae bacterium]